MASDFRSRIVRLDRVSAGDLAYHPGNWRRHPQAQRRAMNAVLEEVGFVTGVITREREDGKLEVIDGHLRTDLASDQTIPVIVTDLSEDEVDIVMATFDPIAEMAEADTEALADLLAKPAVNIPSPELDEFLQQTIGMPLLLDDVEREDSGGGGGSKIGIKALRIRCPVDRADEVYERIAEAVGDIGGVEIGWAK